MTTHCSIENCERAARTRGWCPMHYGRWLRFGSTDARGSRRQSRKGATEAERFWDKVEKTDGCWNWVGAKSQQGYGNFMADGGRTIRPHRWTYERLVGPVPAGLDLDHLCRNRACCNPAHLEPVTRKENSLRGLSPAVVIWRGDACSKGHEYTPDNVYTRPGTRQRRCRRCARDSKARRKAAA